MDIKNIIKTEKMITYAPYKEDKKIFIKAIKILKREGFIKGFIRLLRDFFDLTYHYIAPKKFFWFERKKYKTFCHWYNPTWRGEREIEIPLALELLKKFKGKNIFEVGNVLNYYTKINHDVLDKYEIYKNVINEDIINFKSNKKYDLIISISTIEHIGFDEHSKNLKNVLYAIKNIKNLLSKGGTFFFTIPWGHNYYLEDLIKKKKIKLSDKYLLVKINNFWKQIPFNKYFLDDSLKNKKVLFIGIIKNL